METMIQTSKVHMPIVPKTRIFINRPLDINCQPSVEIKLPQRGSTVPVKIGTLLEPIRQIINHPDRNRLLAEFFKDYK
jgi:hypothetical protein